MNIATFRSMTPEARLAYRNTHWTPDTTDEGHTYRRLREGRDAGKVRVASQVGPIFWAGLYTLEGGALVLTDFLGHGGATPARVTPSHAVLEALRG